MYEELNNSAVLYSDPGDSNMMPFWLNFAEFNSFKLESYSGNFSEIFNYQVVFGWFYNFLFLNYMKIFDF